MIKLIFLIFFITRINAPLISSENRKILWVNPESIEKMYDEYDLSTCPLFTGGFINFGYWENESILNEFITDSERLESEKNLYRKVLQKIEITDQDKVLEVGCGLGYGSALMLSEFSPKEIAAIDFSKFQIQRAKTFHEKTTKSKQLDFQVCKAEKLSFEDCKFEKIISIEAAQHFSSVESFIDESYRVLKPNGKLAIATFFATTSESPKVMSSMIKTVADKIDHLVPISEVYKMLKEAGFENIKIESIGAKVWPYFDRWIAQTELEDTWDRNWYKAYKKKLVDYYIITAEKKEKKVFENPFKNSSIFLIHKNN